MAAGKSGKIQNGKAQPRKSEPQKGRARQAIPEVSNYICGWEFELEARASGAERIAGLDEVGRGPLFGPVVAAAVILPHDAKLDGLTDSKQLSEPERVRLDKMVRDVAIAWAIAEVDAATIDQINILQASRLAMRLAVSRLTHVPDCLLIDGNQRIEWECTQKTIVQGDARCLSIAAASVIAKVYRDRVLCELDEKYPGYGLRHNMGYPTRAHRAALLRLGPTELHRRSFRGVVEVCESVLSGA
jgi:ribonuclease HII